VGHVAAVVRGSAAFVALFGAETGLAKAATLIVVLATAIDVFFDLPVAAHRHDDLYKRFADVAVTLASAPAPTAEMLRECRARRLLIEKDEPHVIAVLNVLCHNEEAEARGYGKDQLWKVRPYQRILSQLFTAPPNDFDPPRVPV
jgi:hypothetical protein